MSGKVSHAPVAQISKPWQEFELSGLATGPLYFYAGAGLSVAAGLVDWNEMACLIWLYRKHYEKAPDVPSCPRDDEKRNAAFLQNFVQEDDDDGKLILSRDSKDPKGLGRTVLLNMMLRYRAPGIRLKPIRGEARRAPGAAERERPGKEPSGDDLKLQSLIWRTGCSGVLTSNYDMLLEHAYALKHGAALRSYRYNADFLRYILSNRRFVLKLHGDINDIRSMEFHPDGAWKSQGTLGLNGAKGNGAHLKNVYRAILASAHVVYVGCGFRDVTIKKLHASWKAGSCLPHTYRIALLPAEELSQELIDRFRGIEFLTFRTGQWHEIREFLERLAAARKADVEVWNPCAEASDIHRQIFLSAAASPVQHFKTKAWTCQSE